MASSMIKKLPDSLLIKGELSNTNDLDNVKDIGLYNWTTSVPSNSPDNRQWSIMLVVKTSVVVKQIVFFGTSVIYIREYAGSPLAWSSWYKIAGTIVS